MKYKTEYKDKTKRTSKSNLTMGAFGTRSGKVLGGPSTGKWVFRKPV